MMRIRATIEARPADHSAMAFKRDPLVKPRPIWANSAHKPQLLVPGDIRKQKLLATSRRGPARTRLEHLPAPHLHKGPAHIARLRARSCSARPTGSVARAPRIASPPVGELVSCCRHSGRLELQADSLLPPLATPMDGAPSKRLFCAGLFLHSNFGRLSCRDSMA